MDAADLGMRTETRDKADRWVVADTGGQELGKLGLITGGAPIGRGEVVCRHRSADTRHSVVSISTFRKRVDKVRTKARGTIAAHAADHWCAIDIRRALPTSVHCARDLSPFYRVPGLLAGPSERRD